MEETIMDPIACTLTSTDLATQAERWHALAARALVERVETEHGVRLVFRPEPGAEDELHALAAVETGCCSWADWRVEASPNRLTLDVRSSGDGVTALHGMFTRLRAGA